MRQAGLPSQKVAVWQDLPLPCDTLETVGGSRRAAVPWRDLDQKHAALAQPHQERCPGLKPLGGGDARRLERAATRHPL